MITEDYCSYEVSKLLNEKDFNGMCDTVIGRDGTKYDIKLYDYVEEEITSCPTHQMAMKWLREVHKISVEIYCIPSYTKGLVVWRYMIRNCESCDEVDYPNGYPAQEYLIFEEAIEAAIRWSLKNLI